MKIELLKLAYLCASMMQQVVFVEAETTQGYFDLTRMYVKQHGRLLAFYSDRHSIFRVNAKEIYTTGNRMTQFSRALHRLDIQLICANTPQAKGRVERVNQLLQDRLVKEMRLLGISNIEEGNHYLPQFIEKYNQKFAVSPRVEKDGHRKPLTHHNLDEILAVQTTKQLSKNLTFQYDNVLYQIQTDRRTSALRRAQVQVIDRQGEIKVKYLGRALNFTTHISLERQGEIVDAKTVDIALIKRKRGAPRRHPWR